MDESWKLDNRRIDAAIHFAVERHGGQTRKGTTRPYILHPMETMTILARMGADSDLLIAGVLHDTLEDTETEREELVRLFGRDAAGLVSAHSEDKSRSWQERKETAVRELRNADRRVKMLVLADKISNLRSMERDLNMLGDALWTRFNAPRERQEWYYSQIRDALHSMGDSPETEWAYRELERLCDAVFVKESG